MAFAKVHGLNVVGSGYIKNASIEQLSTDPTVSVAGRMWYNSLAKRWKMSTDVSGSIVVRSFATYEEFDAFVTSIAAQTSGTSGTSLVGYDGQTGANSQFSLSASKLDVAIDAIVTKIDANSQAISDIGSGNLVNMQTEIDTIETNVGLTSAGAYEAPVGTNYLGSTTTIKGATVALDAAIKTEVDARTSADTNQQTEIDNIESGAGLNADGTFTAPVGTNYLGTSTSLKNGEVVLDTQLKATDTVAQAALARTGGTMTGDISMGSHSITGLVDPVNDSDAANKAYVDATAQGLIVKDAVVAATTANITLSGLLTIDGITLIAGDRVLVKDQTEAKENGIYVAASSGWTRALDMDGSPTYEVKGGCFTFVQKGTDNADSGWVVTSDGIRTVGTDTIEWTQFSGAGQIAAGTGLTKTGNVINVLLGAGIQELPSDEIGIDAHTDGGLFLTSDNSTQDLTTGAKLAIKLNGNTLTKTSDGLKVSDATIATITAAQNEINTVETAVGLNADGTYSAPSGSNYIDATTSVKNALITLDTQIKTNNTSGANAQTELDAVETAVGLNADGTFAAYTGTNYVSAATTVKGTIVVLDTQLKATNDSIDTLKTNINAKVYKVETTTAATSHTVTHNLGASFVEVCVFVKDDDNYWKHDLVGITLSSDNALVVDLTEARNIRVIVRSAEDIA